MDNLDFYKLKSDDVAFYYLAAVTLKIHIGLGHWSQIFIRAQKRT